MSETNGAAPYPPRVQKSFSTLARDALDLAELQFKLFKLDSKAASRILWGTLILAAIGLALLVAALPLAMLAVAEALIENNGWSRMEALGMVSGGGILASAIAISLGWWKFKECLTAWNRSSEELTRNVDWLKSTLSSEEELPLPTSRKTFF
ncbi:phage holin family protein [Bythopirellula polymerisocia]|uniref:Uncharacterized protein n=1 Tax=Bythopirellula polymerisocia TaxID=2528003 RepID=A0A5C6CTG1_9BACT|nr:phage holin family protein [Bythopirellula polymerisocia]TWU27678.1 hypothetical protein Pla144_24550 [Bythopirellula polymerisocia]